MSVERVSLRERAWAPKRATPEASCPPPAAERTALASPLVDAHVITLRVERLLNPRRTEAQLVAVGHRYWLIVAAALVMLVVGTFADAAPFGTIHQVSEKLLERLP